MPVIQISEEVWKKLQERAIPLIDTPNSVLERLLDVYSAVTTHVENDLGKKHLDEEENVNLSTTSVNLKPNPKEQGARFRRQYAESLLKEGIRLNKIKGIAHRTGGRVPVAVPTSTKGDNDQWFLGMAEALFTENPGLVVVLLCAENDKLLDFVLPADVSYKLSKTQNKDKNHQVKFNVFKRSNAHYELRIPGNDPLDLAPYLGNHEPLRHK